MFHVTFRLEGDSMGAFFDSLVTELQDVRPLAKRMEGVLFAANARSRLAGIDGEGNRLADLSEERIKRRIREGKGGGPPLVPDETGSTLVADVDVQTESTSPNRAVVVLTYQNAPWLRYHRQGAPPLPAPSHRRSWRLPKRDIVGFDPMMREDIAETGRQWLLEVTKDAADLARNRGGGGRGAR